MRSRRRCCRRRAEAYPAATSSRIRQRLRPSCPELFTAISESGAASAPDGSASLGGHRADHPGHLHDGVGGESAFAGVLLYRFLVGGVVDAVDLVAGDVALDPLHILPFAIH